MIDIKLGDAYKLIKEIPDKSIDCIYTDPPYEYDAGSGSHSELGKRIKQVKKELENFEIYDGFDYSILDEFVRISKKLNLFIWCSKKQLPYLLNYFVERNYFYELLVWCKTNAIPAVNNTWLPDIEYCLYFREKGVKLNDGYEHKSKYYISAIEADSKKAFGHPTIKPLNLVIKHLQHSCQPGFKVLDPFSGSGTTALACANLGLDFIGFEINEKFYKASMNRLEWNKTITAEKYGQKTIFECMKEGK